MPLQPITLQEAAEAMRAELIGPLDDVFEGVCTDTREDAAGKLFFALQGENSDGHAYVDTAFRQGAAASVVERLVANAPGPLLGVPDSLVALGDLSAWVMSRFDIPVVGVTGSVGKTSTKEMIACALGGRFNLLVSEGNFNNEIGVPKTIFDLEPSHKAAVIEMAMRGAGQIARLAEIARPSIGVITNIGISHVELLGSREAIASAKAELFERLPSDGLAVVNADDEFAAFLANRATCPVVTCAIESGGDYRAESISFSEDGFPRFQVRGQSFAIPAPGVHLIQNALFAIAVAEHLRIALDEVSAQLESYAAPNMRMERIDLPGGTAILNDAYNAAPDSMKAALETLNLMAAGRRSVAILGEMRELGDQAGEAHRYVGELAGQAMPNVLITVGHPDSEGQLARIMLEAASGVEHCVWFPDSEIASVEAPALIEPGDIVLVKGSRALQMERIVQTISYSILQRATQNQP